MMQMIVKTEFPLFSCDAGGIAHSSAIANAERIGHLETGYYLLQYVKDDSIILTESITIQH